MDQNRFATYVGGVITALTIALLFALPLILPVEEIRRSVYQVSGRILSDNPFIQLRIFAGVPGGIITGYLAKDRLGNDDWMTSFKYGAFSVGFGLILVYTLYIVVRIGYALFILWSVPAFYIIFVFPLILALPIAPAILFFGAFAGLFGNLLRLKSIQLP
jgi:hypothetical protein